MRPFGSMAMPDGAVNPVASPAITAVGPASPLAPGTYSVIVLGVSFVT
jgi:hypothetical protein